MGQRLVVQRLEEGATPPAEGGARKVDAPNLSDIRLVFGVGKGPDTPPDDKTFKPVYTVSIPVFSLGGLDSDGVYEFDASALLDLLRGRAQRRRWAVRIELEVVQAAEAVAAADLYIEAPYEGGTLQLGGRSAKGLATPGGGRSLTVTTHLAHDRAQIEGLSGTYKLQLSDAEPGAEGQVQSAVRDVALSLTQYEFEG